VAQLRLQDQHLQAEDLAEGEGQVDRRPDPGEEVLLEDADNNF
jgi:hypothetical protein